MHEAVEATHFLDEVVARPQMEMIGVGENHLRTHRAQLVRVECLHGSESAYRHERRRLDVAVRGVEHSAPCCATLGLDAETEARHADRHAQMIAIASP